LLGVLSGGDSEAARDRPPVSGYAGPGEAHKPVVTVVDAP
jgi:hypothetical protein